MAALKENCVLLNDGTSVMPLLGLGCWQSKPEVVEKAVEVALDNGYRHIDTAYNYLNEEAVGKGIQNWIKKSANNNRKDIFVVTKLPGIGMYRGSVKKFLKLSLNKLGLDYVDLYLVHSPVGFKYHNDDTTFPMTEKGVFDIDMGTDLIAIWKEMENMVSDGLTNAIGISNFNIKQTTKILAMARIPPAVNQVEMHVYLQQKELVDFCEKSKIVLTAYAPLGSPGRDNLTQEQKNSLLSNPVVKLVAENHDVTTAQILIKFLIQRGIVAIPKSIDPDRIKSNGDVFSFDLSETEMDALKLLDKGDNGRTFQMFNYPGILDHPECPYA